MRVETSTTYWVRIYISGALPVIEQTCRRECFQGLCVTVDPTRFIYTGGEETGAVVGLVNYPKFPRTPQELTARAESLALALLKDTFQHSVMVMTPDNTKWLTQREL